jgi:hypothetical protein
MTPDHVRNGNVSFDKITKILHNILTTVAIAILLWVGSTLMELKEETASLNADIRVQSEKVRLIEANMLKATADRYTATDAAGDLELIRKQLERLDTRLSGLELRDR